MPRRIAPLLLALIGGVVLGTADCVWFFVFWGMRSPHNDKSLYGGFLLAEVIIFPFLTYLSSRRDVFFVLSYLISNVAGRAAFYGYVYYLNAPEKPLDWAVDISAGVTIGIIAFFIAWGHFQKAPQPQQPAGDRTPPPPTA